MVKIKIEKHEIRLFEQVNFSIELSDAPARNTRNDQKHSIRPGVIIPEPSRNADNTFAVSKARQTSAESRNSLSQIQNIRKEV